MHGYDNGMDKWMHEVWLTDEWLCMNKWMHGFDNEMNYG